MELIKRIGCKLNPPKKLAVEGEEAILHGKMYKTWYIITKNYKEFRKEGHTEKGAWMEACKKYYEEVLE